MDCEYFSKSYRRIRCKYWNLCHQLGVSLCEVEHRAKLPPLPTKKRRAPWLAWEERKLQLLRMLEGEPITTATFASYANVHHSTAGRWLRRLLEEGDLTVTRPTVIGGKNPQSATYQTIPHKEEQDEHSD